MVQGRRRGQRRLASLEALSSTADELRDASRAGLVGVDHMQGDLRIPSTGEVLAKDVTPTEAFDRLKKWHDERVSPQCGS
jgi:hypothetical protein